ncbi:Sodium/calcium exchanger protein-domain-containing protein [Dichomitus squalens]|uniref:Sodium/calcium exchanger protein-domain-containing protein n=1 Tax=Dichomitus squalens TaxID=114155 RepID=A0A4Q9MX55_9APHY|nr:Sodium/calcium exchanger protein-domain-containing protein [Dichomitus squalens]
MPLNPGSETKNQRKSFVQRVFSGWKRQGQNMLDREAQHHGYPPYDKGGGTAKAPQVRIWHGWRLILFDSWLNILILFLPAAGVLKVTTDSDTLVFVACLLAFVPLIKLHDLATGIVSRRIGGSKTGLLNSSLSNIVELVVAIIALRKCELRVVQSSLIGGMLSKLLLVLGMCFFAGGIRFSEQGFDSTATQIHSSLLSISVGAVLLPAAFHFAITYGSQNKGEAEPSLQEQKDDILRMSHGVAIVLLFIYVSYLVFQLWSHTHLYEDNTEPSAKLPVAASVRSATARVRKKSNSIYERMANARSLDHLRTGSFQTIRSVGYNNKSAGHSRVPTPQHLNPTSIGAPTPISPLEELPETSIDLGDSATRTHGPYLHAHTASGRSLTGGSARAVSPFTSSSQVTLSNPIALPADSTVRLVSDQERFVIRRESLDSDDGSQDSLPAAGDAFDADELDGSPRRYGTQRGRSRTPISDVLSAYYPESLKRAPSDPTPRKNLVQVNLTPGGHWAEKCQRAESPSEYLIASPSPVPPAEEQQQPPQPQPEMSWPLTLFLLTSLTVLVALDAEWLVDSMNEESPLISKEWIGLILLPTVSVMAECATAVNVAAQDQLTLSISVAVGSTIQTALFVIPFMVLLGWVLDKPLALLFDPFESVVLYISVHTMGYVVADGKSNWLEGVILICLYIVIAVTFWFYPGSNFSSNLAVCTTSVPFKG